MGLEELLVEYKEFIPFFVPLLILQVILFLYSIIHILTHSTYKRGSRGLWLIICIVLCNYLGPILYFVLGKDD